MYNNPGDDSNNLLYDLRQYYAKILGEHLLDAMEHRKTGDFYQWLKALEDIKTITLHKWPDKVKGMERFNILIKDIIELANKYPEAWTKKGNDTYQISLIENKLRLLEEYLYGQMEKAHIFGESYSTAGL